MSSHTPVPWTVFYKHKYDEWHVSVPSEGGGMKLALFVDGCPTGEHDARLIAAAPDLLAALTTFVAHYPMGINPFLDEAYRSARAAISKAGGAA